MIKFDREAISTGQVDPKEVIKAINNGAEVYSCSNLHAKVYVFGNIAVVGSSNVSQNSDRYLLEACVETTEKKIVSSAERFIRSLLGDRVGIDYAKKMLSFYRPPMRPTGMRGLTKKKRQLPLQSDLWLVSLVEGRWQDIDYEQEEKGRPIAEKEIKNREAFDLKEFQWSGKAISRYKVGARIIQCTKTRDGKVLVSPTSRVVGIHKYSVKDQKRAIVYLETPKKYRRRTLDSFLRSLGPHAKQLGNPRRTKLLRNADLIYSLGRLWL